MSLSEVGRPYEKDGAQSMKLKKGIPPAPPAAAPTTPSAMDKVAAWLLFGLTVVSLGFTAYMVTIDKIDVTTGVSTAVGVVAALNIIVFRKPVSRSVRRGTVQVLRGLANILDVPAQP
jgi:hypothetical protein